MTASSGPLIAALTQPYVETHAIPAPMARRRNPATLIELAGAGRQRSEGTKKNRGSQFVLHICVIPAAIVLVVSPRIVPAAEIRPPIVSVVAGIVIFFLGEAIRAWSKLALGRHFTYTVMTGRDQPVISGGPYRYLRLPSYTGILLIALGPGPHGDTGLVWV
jgi:protein-S-isoprenylcysteine O-methyltransferase Ste14